MIHFEYNMRQASVIRCIQVIFLITTTTDLLHGQSCPRRDSKEDLCPGGTSDYLRAVDFNLTTIVEEITNGNGYVILRNIFSKKDMEEAEVIAKVFILSYNKHILKLDAYK